MTCEGGIWVDPSALFKIERTTAIFTKLVISKRMKGSSEIAAMAMKSNSGWDAIPCVLSTFIAASAITGLIGHASAARLRELR
jgi:hypothetical protein